MTTLTYGLIIQTLASCHVNIKPNFGRFAETSLVSMVIDKPRTMYLFFRSAQFQRLGGPGQAHEPSWIEDFFVFIIIQYLCW